MRIVARSNQEENVDQLYAAGADFVISNSSVGANILNNVLEGKETIFLTEGIDVFRAPLPASLVGLTIAESQIRPIIGIRRSDCFSATGNRSGGGDGADLDRQPGRRRELWP